MIKGAWIFEGHLPGFRWRGLTVPRSAHSAGPTRRKRPYRWRLHLRRSCNLPLVFLFRARQRHPGGMLLSEWTSHEAPRGGQQRCGGSCKPAVSARRARPLVPTRRKCRRSSCSIHPRFPGWFRRARWPTMSLTRSLRRGSRPDARGVVPCKMERAVTR